ncbi:NAD(P)H-hydrate epimerase [Coccidioides immitis RS]|uniref:NAD(P)H-hydrate epimerase n=2 Tax=Coccidioides immitis TaxID=5501 RepID=J3K8Z4_COCIM|nr:NAD(P)H-hydrate epimerase [Coccidioides immitis RS]EAS31333.3 NAD(P)H-hydrate epimerase [Coccidioides immitis RS]KMU86122.1 meiotically up-regulated gene 182 protein [Coccidioides immitis H538.4]
MQRALRRSSQLTNSLFSSARRYKFMSTMALKTITAQNAAALDKDLMDSGAFSIDQLMELAGLSVSQAVYKVHPPCKGKNVLIVCGPGNNGGDGLVCARHLAHYGYNPTIYYPKHAKNELYERLKVQLHNLSVPFTDDFAGALSTTTLIVDAIFGFSFGGPLREPYPAIISQIESAKVPVVSVDAPSSWDIETGPPKDGPGARFMPEVLVSLTAPKPCVKFFRGRHFIGGRFLTKATAEKYGLDVPDYPGIDQVMEIDVEGSEKL